MTTQSSWMRAVGVAVTLGVAMPGLAQTQGTAPTGGSGVTTTAPAATVPSAGTKTPVRVVADYSSPVSTVQTMLTAIQQGDFLTVREAMDIPAAHADDVNALLGTMEATAELQRAAAVKFLAAGDKAFGTPTAAMLSDQLKQVATSVVVIRNEDATLSLPANADLKTNGGEIQLKKMGGSWKVEGAAFFKLDADAGATAARVALAKKMTAISQAMSVEIGAGKYFSAADAYIEYWNRCQAAAK